MPWGTEILQFSALETYNELEPMATHCLGMENTGSLLSIWNVQWLHKVSDRDQGSVTQEPVTMMCASGLLSKYITNNRHYSLTNFWTYCQSCILVKKNTV